MQTNKKEKPRFHDAQPGDEVYSMIHGDCFIAGIGYDLIYIKSYKHDFTDMAYTFNGNYFNDIGEPVIFYRKGDEKYLTERPEIKVYWAKVEEGTEIEVQCPNELWVKRFFYAYTPDKVFPIITMELSGWNRLERWGKARLINV